VVGDTYLIPADALDRAAVVEVGLRPFPEGDWLPPETGTGAGPLLRIEKPRR
jgi:hypothetical protein